MFLEKFRNKKLIKVKLSTRDQEIHIGQGNKSLLIEEVLKRDYSSAIVFIDRNMSKMEKSFLQLTKKEIPIREIVEVDPTETSKSVEFLNIALEKCIRHKLNRRCCIIAIGGGIVGDAAGFLASVYMRGVDMIFIPTTLMAQGDTIINKVALSYKFLKNVFGSFYSPVLTICDTGYLNTLPRSEISLGLSEIIKHGLIQSPNLISQLDEIIKPELADWQSYPWQDIIYESLKVKSTIVSKDPEDKFGIHKGLSYGHTFANVFEGLSGFNFRHGEAISVGMTLAGLVSFQLGMLKESELNVQQKLLEKALLPVEIPKVNLRVAINLLKADKISTKGEINLVLLRGLGKFVVYKNVDPVIVKKVFRVNGLRQM